MRIKKGDTVEFEGRVETIRYGTKDGEFQVLVVRTERKERITCVVRGAALMVDEHVKIFGTGARHKSGELQVEVDRAERKLPANREGIIAFLSSPQIKDIGPARAKRIVDAFGEDTIRVLTEEPHRLREVDGIGKERSKSIAESWGRTAAVRGILIFLQSNGISPAFANRIHRRYGHKAVAILSENPYRLARDVKGIGFLLADTIASRFGIGQADARRLEAGLEYALYDARREGHVFLPEALLIDRAAELLRQSAESLREPLDELVLQRRLVRESSDRSGDHGPPIYPLEAFQIEAEIAARVDALLRGRALVPPIGEAEWGSIREQFGFELSPEQRGALESLATEPVGVLTGGPGTGKTTIVRALVHHAEAAKLEVALAAPTGRAAQRLAESTGRKASTIHRLLGFDPRAGGFQRNEVEPLEVDVIIVDEASMIDAELGKSLLAAIAPGTQLIFVGDRDQLPPVGPGCVLADVIDSGCVLVANLNRVFRQGERSEIVVAAHEVRNGLVPEGSAKADGEFFFVRREEPDALVEALVEIVTKRIPSAFGLDPVDDVQVLVPVHRGPVGTRAINERLQEQLGGKGAHIRYGDNKLHVGDKVMQIRNNYRLETFNGDIGRIVGLDAKKRTLTIDYDGRTVEYGEDDLKELELAYAISVHKSQGSEFPAVVMALSTHHFKLLQRKLVYTAMTRAKQRLIIVGKPYAFQLAIENVSGVARYTGLAERVRARCADRAPVVE